MPATWPSQRTAAVEVASAALGRPIEPLIQFGVVANGLGVELTVEEAAVLATLPTIAHIAPEPVYELHTDSGPAHIGAAELWSHPTLATRGEGVLVGLFDTGIDPTNPSFAATSALMAIPTSTRLGRATTGAFATPTRP